MRAGDENQEGWTNQLASLRLEEIEKVREKLAWAEEALRMQRNLVNEMASSPDLDEAFHRLLDAATRIEGIDCGGVYLIDNLSGDLRLSSHKGLSREFVEQVRHYSADSLHARLVRSGKTLYAPYCTLIPNQTEIDCMEALRSVAVIPITYQDQIVAVINLGSHTHDEIPVNSRYLLEDLVGHIAGVIARIRAETALRKSEAKYRALFENANDAIFLVKENKIVECNARALELLGCSKEAVLGENPMSFAPIFQPSGKESAELAVQRINDTLSGVPQFFECTLKHCDDTPFDAQVNLNRIDMADERLVLAIVRDITTAKQAQEALQAAYRQLQNIIEFLPDATLVIDSEGRIIGWNRAIEGMTGIPKEDMLGKGDYEYAIPFYGYRRPLLADLMIKNAEAGWKKFYHHLERRGNTGFAEEHVPGIYGGEGGYIWATASVLCDCRGNCIGAIESIRDITDRKQMESDLIQREKELEKKSRELEEINTALKVLLKHREMDQQEFGARVLSNMKELVFPYVEKLASTHLSEIQRTYLNILESHLKEISAPFVKNLCAQYTNLSPTELQVASLIKQGKRNKEIAQVLGVSLNTVLTHRYHLRTKLGLKNKKVNMVSHLKSISLE